MTDSADAIRAVRDKIVGQNFFVLSCDLITDAFLHHFADVHRLNDATVSVLLHAIPPPRVAAGVKPPKREKALVDYFGLEARVCGTAGRRLAFMGCAADLDGQIDLPMPLLKRCPDMRLHADYLDAHFYIFSRWVLDVLDERPHISDLKNELLPLLVRKQFSSQILSPPMPAKDDMFSYDGPAGFLYNSQNNVGIGRLAAADMTKLRCFAYIHDGGVCQRAQNIALFREMNFDMARAPHSVFSPWGVVPVEGDLRRQVGGDCVLGQQFQVGTKSSVKRSIIGDHCVIGANCKLVGCIVFDHVRVEDGCTLTNCTIGSNCVVQEKAVLKECELGGDVVVDAGSTMTKEQLVKSEALD